MWEDKCGKFFIAYYVIWKKSTSQTILHRIAFMVAWYLCQKDQTAIFFLCGTRSDSEWVISQNVKNSKKAWLSSWLWVSVEKNSQTSSVCHYVNFSLAQAHVKIIKTSYLDNFSRATGVYTSSTRSSVYYLSPPDVSVGRNRHI